MVKTTPGGHSASGPIQINPQGINLGNAMQLATQGAAIQQRKDAAAARGKTSGSTSALLNKLFNASPSKEFDGTINMSGELGARHSFATMSRDQAKVAGEIAIRSGDDNAIRTALQSYYDADLQMRQVDALASGVARFGKDVSAFETSTKDREDILFVDGAVQWDSKARKFLTKGNYIDFQNSKNVSQLSPFIKPDEVNTSFSNDLHTTLNTLKANIEANTVWSETTTYGVGGSDIQMIGDDKFIRSKNTTRKYKIAGVAAAYNNFAESIGNPEIGKEFNSSMFKAINANTSVITRDDELSMDPNAVNSDKASYTYNLRDNYEEYESLLKKGRKADANNKFIELQDQYAKHLMNSNLDLIPEYHSKKDGLFDEVDENLRPVLKGIHRKASGTNTTALMSPSSMGSLVDGTTKFTAGSSALLQQYADELDETMIPNVNLLFDNSADQDMLKIYNSAIDGNKGFYSNSPSGKLNQMMLKWELMSDVPEDDRRFGTNVAYDKLAPTMTKMNSAVDYIGDNDIPEADKNERLSELLEMDIKEVNAINRQYVNTENRYSVSDAERKEAMANKKAIGTNDVVFIGGTQQNLKRDYPIVDYVAINSGVLVTDDKNDMVFNGATMGALMLVDNKGLSDLKVRSQYYDDKSNSIKLKSHPLGESSMGNDERTDTGKGYKVVMYKNEDIYQYLVDKNIAKNIEEAKVYLKDNFTDMELSTDMEFYTVQVNTPIQNVIDFDGKSYQFNLWNKQTSNLQAPGAVPVVNIRTAAKKTPTTN